MKNPFQDLLRDATRLTQIGRLSEATAAIQRALGGQPLAKATPDDVLDGCVFETPAQPQHTDAESWREASHTAVGLTRAYKLYVPPGPRASPPALIVMLHGCTQNPDDFAAGTAMNARAREQGFCVLYPAQSQDANPQRCWNWFKHSHQTRGRGETALIASMTQAVMREQGIAPQRVYIAGLSAGGAMAALVGAAYPELYAAVGVHSGLAPGAAASLPEALAAMQGKAGARPSGALQVPLIVFHGDQDTTVHPRNGEQLIAALGHPTLTRQEPGVSPRGQRYTRSVYAADPQHPAAEHWLLHGAGHAWSGGGVAGSYTDAKGPDATGEMLRFFFEHPRRA